MDIRNYMADEEGIDETTFIWAVWSGYTWFFPDYYTCLKTYNYTDVFKYSASGITIAQVPVKVLTIRTP